MIVWHFFRVFIHLMAGLLTCAVVFPFVHDDRRDYLVRRWSVKLLAICTVDVAFKDKSEGAVNASAMIVSNHISWLDIFVINTLHPCHFVAKSDIRNWPLLGWLCEKAGTIFLVRGRQRDVRRIYEGLVHQIQAGKRIAFFPEGTTTSQGNVLSFHANLFEAAIEAHVPVQPFVVRYLDAQGQFHSAADFIGDMTFAESMRIILLAPRMTAELVRLPTIPTDGAHRRDVARLARAAVMRELGVTEA
ncbi:1-acyl-sn-glycerol-3-phosphate acyltransferase [Undibacterium sp. CY18W]|uniref:1-acyl-sn-glycerol-3-phosphate acyltransferase n=1 Tax=Undibacterium hunanense TaxID=2762292 RepID=A0ABR6ZPJ2_9BURK|nr:lysophospholipid acyltransferase family protein [Undibacterium hunanense]MBC3917792.1 1-acyl-sn-glycerol-3-phosphate acyltransferase [Undibacterium hunanense]